MGGLQVREGFARVRFAAEVAVQDLAREPPPAEAEGQGERENKPAEGDPKATSTISFPMPRCVMAVAAAKRSTAQRMARASSRASGTCALTAAMRAPSPRKFEASHPMRKISPAPRTRGRA